MFRKSASILQSLATLILFSGNRVFAQGEHKLNNGKCGACGQEVNSLSYKCRNCGALTLDLQQGNRVPNPMAQAVGCGSVVIIVAMALILIFRPSGAPSESFTSQRSSTSSAITPSTPAARAAFIAHINQLIKGGQEDTTQAIALINARFAPEQIGRDAEIRTLLDRVIAADKDAGKPQAATDYADRVTEHWLPELAKLSADDLATSDQLWKVRDAFEEFARRAEDGKEFGAGDAAVARATLIKAISAKQISIFPKLRSAYAALVDQEMWRIDVDVAALGAGNRTIRFTGARFAANRNIGDAQDAAARLLSSLRFKKASYEWFRGARQSQFYDIASPADSDVGTWKYGVFRKVSD